jgi:cholest-4-en-3-one 26-monooxygenase
MYANELASQRRSEPREDIITTLTTEHDGDILSEHEFDLFVLLLSVAGNETTRNGISHGLLALIEHPDAWSALKDDPELVKTAIEEMLRWGTPVNNFRRTATGDVLLHGVTIAEGDAVVMFYASANRDESVFPDAHRFDLKRPKTPHSGFGGGGVHYCLGHFVAKTQLRALFSEILTKLPDMEVGEPEPLFSEFINGVRHLPVHIP